MENKGQCMGNARAMHGQCMGNAWAEERCCDEGDGVCTTAM